MTLRRFRATCLTLAIVYVLIAGTILLRGPMVAMAEYGVPASILASPDYADAMCWVLLHMTVIGVVIGCVGWFAEGVRMQRPSARLMLLAIAVYPFLDVRTADWALGSALYRGKASLGPVIVDALAIVLWVRSNLVHPVPVRAGTLGA